jgi:hypothetical protein
MERSLRFLGGVVGTDVPRAGARCAQCGQVHPRKQPSAAVLAGAVVPLDPTGPVPPPPDLGSALRAARGVGEPVSRVLGPSRVPGVVVDAPSPPIEIPARPTSPSVPSPSADALRDSIVKSRR